MEQMHEQMHALRVHGHTIRVPVPVDLRYSRTTGTNLVQRSSTKFTVPAYTLDTLGKFQIASGLPLVLNLVLSSTIFGTGPGSAKVQNPPAH